MADYAIYIDDSGHPDDQPYVVAAGFISTEEKWLAFDPAWKIVLERHTLPFPFHMTDFMANGYRASQRSAILGDLVSVIHKHTIACFAGAVDVEAYKRVNGKYALQEYLGAPYALAARIMAIQINKWRERNLQSGDNLLLFAEQGTKHRGDMLDVFKRDRLPEPISVEKSLTAVQPADMLAWEMFCFLRGCKNDRRMRRIVRNQRQFGVILREKDLIATCTEGIPAVSLRSELGTNPKIVFHSSPKKHRRRTIH